MAWSLATGIDLAAPDALERARGVRLAGKPVLPHFAVPTTLSAAELSGSSGFSAEGTNEKVGVAARELVPKAVFYDVALAVHTPLDLWFSTGIRAVDHAVETLLAPGEHPLPDAAALESLRLLSELYDQLETASDGEIRPSPSVDLERIVPRSSGPLRGDVVAHQLDLMSEEDDLLAAVEVHCVKLAAEVLALPQQRAGRSALNHSAAEYDRARGSAARPSNA